jgi:hypothetical protein
MYGAIIACSQDPIELSSTERKKYIVVTKIHHLQIPQPVKNHARALEMWLYPQKPCCKDEDSQVGFCQA